MLNSTRLWKLLKIAKFSTPTPQDVLKKGSKILKLPPVRNCFTLAMTYRLVVIINSLKVPKIKKSLTYEMKFLVPNYSCLQNPWLGGYRPQIPVLSVLNWICWTPPSRTKFLGTPLRRATQCWLDEPGFRAPVKARDFSSPKSPCRFWGHLAFYSTGTGVLSSGVKVAGEGSKPIASVYCRR